MTGAHRGGFDSRLCALAAAAMLAAGAVAAQPGAYPAHPIRLIVPFAAGGLNDVVARLIGPHLERSLGQPVIVDNRPAASGIVGTDAVAKAAPDGHWLLMVASSHAVVPATKAKLPYDAERDLAPIVMVAKNSMMFLVHPKVAANSLAQFIAAARADPGGLNYASPGAASQTHLVVELLSRMAGIKLQHIPYRGGGPATMALLEGTVHVGSVALAPVEPLIKEGKLRALAVTGAERWFSLPDVPTMIESGFPGFVSDTFNALFAPTGTPPEIVALLARESQAALKTPEAREQAHRAGYQIVGGTPAELAARLRTEIPAVKELVGKLGIKPQ